MQELILTSADNGKSVSASLEDIIIIKIPENPTTGFRWEFEELDNKFLEMQTMDFLRESTTLIGTGGEKSFTLKIKQLGSTSIRLKLWRDWEGDSSVVQRYEVNIQVTA
jgi:inhibitor of cysteine peptidase